MKCDAIIAVHPEGTEERECQKPATWTDGRFSWCDEHKDGCAEEGDVLVPVPSNSGGSDG